MTDNFAFTGDFRFEENDAWLTFRIPTKVLRTLISSSTKHLQIERHEIVGLLRAIEQNPRTSEAKRRIVQELLQESVKRI
jgi:hypothetical protein